VQDTNDLDDTLQDRPIVDDVHGLSDGIGASIWTRMSQMETANPGKKVLSVPRHWALGIGGNLSHRGHQEGGVPPSGVIAPALAARREDLFEIGLRRAREPKSRHSSADAARCGSAETRHVRLEVRLTDLHELAPLERIDASLKMGAQRFQLERVLASALLEDAQGVPYRFARILVLTSLDQLLDEGVLLWRQTDIPGGHDSNASSPDQRIMYGKVCQ